MIIKVLEECEKDLISIEELRTFLRLDSDVFDENLKQFLKAGISEFQTRTNRILISNIYRIEFYNERVILAPFDTLINANFNAEFRTNLNILYCIGSGKMDVKLGYEELPQDIKLWLKNYVLTAFDGASMPKISNALVSRYKVAFF
ncbi:head-tail connector protein [Campylobacter estrildidarum]|uniref:Phage gp6-like head-tail connector protein n=1 Tax=Campylobacter estrildidarum TaxID=2510189 RepID=A0A4U7BKK8_9BACT|nr:phage gp6-like head-tail connector protein [Campylobacter estrildidarum]TKX30650.1 phage gp6-like head-tail connector protein [Campylobacter estrildidarum]